MGDRCQKKVSIIVAAYNVEEYIDRCLKSLLGQTYSNFEIIIVNDGSTDKTLNQIKQFKDNRIIIVNKKNGGLSSARNVGLKYCTGEYIVQFDGDDYVELNWLESCMMEFGVENSDAVFFGLNSVDEIGRELKYGIRKEYEHENFSSGKVIIEKLAKDEFKNYSVGFLLKREVLNSIEKPIFPPNIAFEDLASTYKLMMVTGKVSVIPGVFYHYVQHTNSITHTPSFSQFEDLKKIESVLLTNLAGEVSDTVRENWKLHIEIMQYQILSYEPRKNRKLLKNIKKSILSLNVEKLRLTEKIKIFLLRINLYKYLYPYITKIRLV